MASGRLKNFAEEVRRRKIGRACCLTVGSSERGSIISVEPRRGVDGWDKAALYIGNAFLRR
jgi:hypothetical protein